MYRLIVLASALKDLRTIPTTYEGLIRGRIYQFASDPRPRGCKKLEDRLYRVRQGAYRIIYRINDEDRVVTVARVKPKKEAYR